MTPNAEGLIFTTGNGTLTVSEKQTYTERPSLARWDRACKVGPGGAESLIASRWRPQWCP